jgi:hypothetical protein
MGPCTRQVAELLVLAAGLAAASTTRNEINASTTQRTPLELTPALFNATGATVRANSSWGVATTHAPEPENERSVTFWGRFVAEPCAGEVWGFTAHHPAPGIAGGAHYPDCGGAFGPSFEADVTHDGTHSHLMRTQASPEGPFASYSSAGQNPSGANKYITATYTDFNPSWKATVSRRMRPWLGAPSLGSASGGSGGSGELRATITARQAVSTASIPEPTLQQLQQDVNVLFINEACNQTASRSYCQIAFNIKTFIKGVHAYTPSSDATAFNDGGQGGLIAVVGPINTAGLTTVFKTTSGAHQTAWTSRGPAMQTDAFERQQSFCVEISWAQFKGVLLSVTAGAPVSVFGEEWATPAKWVLLRAGWGQENYNNGSTVSVIEGTFGGLQIASQGSPSS